MTRVIRAASTLFRRFVAGGLGKAVFNRVDLRFGL
jgi:hypothetical protein